MTTSERWRVSRAAGILILLLAGFSSRVHAQRPDDCAVGTPAVPFDVAKAGAMAGRYELQLVSTEPEYPSTALGQLGLTLADSQQRHLARYPGDGSWQPWLERPLIGWATINVASVGGAYELDLSSREPGLPGASVNRFGTLSLGSRPYIYDGQSTELAIKAVGPRGFRGTWLGNHGIAITVDSTTGRIIKPGGWFCAKRVSD